MRHQVEKGTFSYENKERTKREKLVRTKWAFHRFGALTVFNTRNLFVGGNTRKAVNRGQNDYVPLSPVFHN